MRRLLYCVFVFLITFGCVDRIDFDVPIPDKVGLSISGHITTSPGPHRVNIFRNFDIQSTDSLKTGLTARRVVISDTEGNSAELTQVRSGIYETTAGAISGKVGGIYKLRVELRDGSIYESIPDTLQPVGVVDSAWYQYHGRPVPGGYIYEYEIFANALTNADVSKTFYRWSNRLTYKATTHPDCEKPPRCYPQPDNPGLCNYVAPCSGVRNIGNNTTPSLEKVGDCSCCTCWFDQYSSSIVLSDDHIAVSGRFNNLRLDLIELTGWNMMYKMRMEVRMESLSYRAYLFWRTVRDQQDGVTSLFQPNAGQIRGNIIQLEGRENPVHGIFYTTALSTKAFYITRGDTPVRNIPSIDFPGAGCFPCMRLAPNAMTVMPDFWIE